MDEQTETNGQERSASSPKQGLVGQLYEKIARLHASVQALRRTSEDLEADRQRLLEENRALRREITVSALIEDIERSRDVRRRRVQRSGPAPSRAALPGVTGPVLVSPFLPGCGGRETRNGDGPPLLGTLSHGRDACPVRCLPRKINPFPGRTRLTVCSAIPGIYTWAERQRNGSAYQTTRRFLRSFSTRPACPS